MPDPFPQFIVPLPQQPDLEVLEPYRVSLAFYDEVRRRQALEEYHQWYVQTAEQNRRDLEMMRREFNIMGFFSRSRK